VARTLLSALYAEVCALLANLGVREILPCPSIAAGVEANSFLSFLGRGPEGPLFDAASAEPPLLLFALRVFAFGCLCLGPPSPVEIAPRGRGGLQPGVGELFTHLSSRTEQMHRETMHLRSRGTPGQSARIRTASQDRASTSRTECRGGCIASQFRRRGLTPVKSLARLISPQILHPADNILTFSMSHFRHPTCHTGSRETCAQLLATSYQLLATGLPAL
jgi:hypothetical protein